VDPLVEKYYSWTPYQYVRGDPILRIGPNGMYDAEAWEKKNRDEMELLKQQDLSRMGVLSPPGFNWGGSSSGRMNDELPPPLVEEKKEDLKESDYILQNGKKVYWDDIETGSYNYLSLIGDKSKIQFSHQQTLDWLHEWEKVHGSISANVSRLSWGFGLSSYLSKAIGAGGFTVLQLESELHGMISDSYDQLSYLYNNLSDRNGLWMIQTQNTFINSGLVTHTSSFDFYLPNGSLFFSITY
jgi:hypothetical protein